MTLLFVAFFSFVGGAAITYLSQKKIFQQKLESRAKLLQQNHDQYITQLKLQHEEVLKQTNTLHQQQHSILQQELESRTKLLQQNHNQYITQLKLQHEEVLKQANTLHQQQYSILQQHLENNKLEHEMTLQQGQELWKTQIEVLRKEIQKTAAQELNAKQEALQQSNRSQLDALLQPLQKQFEAFRNSVEDGKKQGELHQLSIKSTFESTMKLFEQQQQNVVEQLRQQTERIGNDAANLSKALKSDNKVQGDWGEMILSSILDNSGLRKGKEYFVQESVKDEEGQTLRPDVIVRFPEGRSVVIDSKVSLTAYSEAANTLDETERKARLRDHVSSLRKHVDELSTKDYGNSVNDAIGFVLMFVPNENSYIAAMQQDPTLSQYAYNKHVVIISPSNLLMALKLAYNLWQYDRQTKNVEKIVKTASDLYDKVSTFQTTLQEISTQFIKLTKSFDTANNQLSEGRGNILGRIESLRKMGITPKKKLALAQEIEDED